MKIKDFYKKYEDNILSIVIVFIIALVVSVKYDAYFELNDDTMMRNILSGTYSGKPNALCYFILYPLSFIISSLYNILPVVPWYEIILCGCQYLCMILILTRLLKICDSLKMKFVVVIAFVMFTSVFLLQHLVFVTFTIVSGILSITAIFLFITENDRKNILKKSIKSIVLLAIAFCIRYMMVFMMIPFICISGIYQWSKEEEIFSLKNIKKYIGIFSMIILSLAVVYGIDRWAYSSEEWKNFQIFSENRATIYDYTEVPLYEDNLEFYESNNISYEQYLLLRSYDFALDEEIDYKMMKSVAEYAKSIGADLREKINIAIGAYRIQITDKIGTKYHTLTLIGYIILLMSIRSKNKFRVIVLAGMMFFTRSLIWLYLLGQGRTPERITHPLYWMEFILLIAFFIFENAGKKADIKHIRRIYIAVTCSIALCALFLESSVLALNEKYNIIYNYAERYEKVTDYCAENNEKFYFMPVYSLRVPAEKVFLEKPLPSNMELLGGWAVKSPIHYEKLEYNKIDSIENAIINDDNVYIIQHSDYISYDTTYPFEWLIGYYDSKGVKVDIVQNDVICDNICVYKVQAKDN